MLQLFSLYGKLSAKFLLLIIWKYPARRRNGTRLTFKLIPDGSFPIALQLLIENTLCPLHSGSEFYNKGFYSIVLLSFVDYDCKF